MGVFMILNERLQHNYQHFTKVQCKILEDQSSISLMISMTLSKFPQNVPENYE